MLRRELGQVSKRCFLVQACLRTQRRREFAQATRVHGLEPAEQLAEPFLAAQTVEPGGNHPGGLLVGWAGEL
jgi:hypothetical protein